MLATERISIRTTPHAKSVVEQASQLTGVSMSSFIMDIAYQKAVEMINNQQRITLNSKEWQNAIELLDNPPEPNDKMKALFKRGYQVVD